MDAIFWDFDGVILRSNEIRDEGFKLVLKDFPTDEVGQLLDFHRANGGLSRYVKFRYFFEKVRGESVTDAIIQSWATKFSSIMLERLTDPTLLIDETVAYIRNHHQKIPFYIVSGSDQTELRQLCETLGIDSYFKRIHGSPQPKTEWVGQILEEEGHLASSCLLIGDSRNDYQAAMDHGLDFMAYGNPALNTLTTYTINLNS